MGVCVGHRFWSAVAAANYKALWWPVPRPRAVSYRRVNARVIPIEARYRPTRICLSVRTCTHIPCASHTRRNDRTEQRRIDGRRATDRPSYYYTRYLFGPNNTFHGVVLVRRRPHFRSDVIGTPRARGGRECAIATFFFARRLPFQIAHCQNQILFGPVPRS